MKKNDYIQNLLEGRKFSIENAVVSAYAPSNIALCKYWGKRDIELNLPMTSSLSVSLAEMGTTTVLKVNDEQQDTIIYNGQQLDVSSEFTKRVIQFLDLFRQQQEIYFEMNTQNTLPQSAGFASSASGYAALMQAIDLLCDWHLSDKQLSLLARLGSGSASRSLWHGFVEWHQGVRDDGMDSYAEPLDDTWPEFCMGLILVCDQQKPISSRKAMQVTQATSPDYKTWPKQVACDLKKIKKAITFKDFTLLGETAEQNATTMHALMRDAKPAIIYSIPETLKMMDKVWELRKKGVEVYFTQDAGPNLKLIFRKQSLEKLQNIFPGMMVVEPFSEFITHE